MIQIMMCNTRKTYIKIVKDVYFFQAKYNIELYWDG